MKILERILGKESEKSINVDGSENMAIINGYDEINTEKQGVMIQDREGKKYYFPNAVKYCGMEEFEPKWHTSLQGSYLQTIEELDGKKVTIYYMTNAISQIAHVFKKAVNTINIYPIQGDKELILNISSLGRKTPGYLEFNYKGIDIIIKDLAKMKIN